METCMPWVSRFLHHVTVTRRLCPAISARYTSVTALWPDLVADDAVASGRCCFSPDEKQEGTENRSCILYEANPIKISVV
jgi:hypothetical protein